KSKTQRDPEYYFSTNKVKFVPNEKVASRTANMSIADVPVKNSKGTATGDIVAPVTPSELNEVIVDSYRSTTVAKTAAAVTTISIDDIQSKRAKVGKGTADMLAKESAKIPSTALAIQAVGDRTNHSALQSLQGQVAGLNIASGSGQPGADSTIILRGTGTINGNTEPLFI